MNSQLLKLVLKTAWLSFPGFFFFIWNQFEASKPCEYVSPTSNVYSWQVVSLQNYNQHPKNQNSFFIQGQISFFLHTLFPLAASFPQRQQVYINHSPACRALSLEAQPTEDSQDGKCCEVIHVISPHPPHGQISAVRNNNIMNAVFLSYFNFLQPYFMIWF